MPFDPLNPFPNTFVDAPFVERKKGFGEQFVDDLANMSLKQTLGTPLSVPLQAGLGGLKGATFGLLDFTDDAQDALGDFGLPDTVSTSLNIAGEIGGSFVPFIGASKVAHRLFQGLGLAADLARGATTFGAPELVRQALTQEFSPQAGARSLATGAAFALPLPRIALAPAVAGTELLLGADPLEAAAAGLFAGLFGSMSKKPLGLHAEVPPKIPSQGVNPKSGLGKFQEEFRKGGEVVGDTSPSHFTAGPKIAQDLTEPLPVPVKNVLREVMDDLSLNKPGTKTAADIELLESVAPAFGRTGQRQLFPAMGGGKTQAQVMNEVALKNSGTKLGENAAKMAKQVELEAAGKSATQLSLQLDDLVRTAGPQAPETNVARWALAEAEGKFVGPGSPVTNELAKVPQLRGVNMIEQGPSNPFIVRAETQKLLGTLRGGPRTAQLKAQQLDNILREGQDAVRRARGRGKELDPGKITELTLKMEAALASKEVGIQTRSEAENLMRDMMGQHTTPEAVMALAKNPPPEILKVFPNGSKRFQQMAEDRAQVLKYVFEDTGAKQFRPETRRTPAGLDELRRRASDHGMAVTPRGRFTQGAARPHPSTAGREVIDSFQMTLGGQNVRKFKSVKQADAWVSALERGPRRDHADLGLSLERGPAVLGNNPNTSGSTKAFSSAAETLTLQTTTGGMEGRLQAIVDGSRVSILSVDVPGSMRGSPVVDKLFRGLGRELQSKGLTEKSIKFTSNIVNERPEALRRLGRRGIRQGLADPVGVDPTDIHELRALAHPRSIDVVYNGNGTVTLTNTMSGETLQGGAVADLKRATEVVRQAPNIASASREIGPPVPVGHPPLSGTGSIGSIAAEQPPIADVCGMPAFPRKL